MKFFGNYRRGQIRGIDFSLAMIIFLLTMSQVLVLTSTFIENAQESQGVNSSLALTETYASDLIYSPGISNNNIDWHDIETIDLDVWRFGLSNGNGSVDPFKLGRLANNSQSDYLLDYDDLQSATTFDKDFEIKFRSTIEVSISTTTIIGNQITVDGFVKKSNEQLDDATVNIFVVDENSVAEANTVTSASGFFETTATINSASPYHVVVVMAQYGVGNYDVDYRIANGSPTQVGQTLTSSTGNGYTINSIVESGANNFFALSMGTGSNVTTGITTGLSSDISIPQEGMVVIFAADSSSFAITTFPLIIDNYLYSTISSLNPSGTQSTSVVSLVNVRGVFLQYSFLTWS